MVATESSERVQPRAETNIYKLESKDNVILEISDKAIKQSTTLGLLVVNLGYDTKKPEEREPIPVTNVLGACLKKLVEWCEKHQNDELITDKDQPRDVVITEWDGEFLKIDNDELFDLICAANYLDIRGLMDVSCKTVANMAKGKNPDELRLIFGIKSDEEDEAEEKAATAAATAAKNWDETDNSDTGQ